MDLNDDLNALRPALIAAAQAVYDEWDDEPGGICTDIAKAMISVIEVELSGATATVVKLEYAHSGVEVTRELESYRIDLPHPLYEYNPSTEDEDYDRTYWVKKPGVTFEPDNLRIWRTVPPK